MAPATKNIAKLLERVSGDVKDVPRIVQEGRKAAYSGEGTGSMFLWPIMALLKKLKGEGKVNSFLYEKYLRRLKNADERAGKFLAHHAPSENWFKIKENVPVNKKIKGLPASVEHDSYSAMAPVAKTMKVVTPLAGGMYLTEKLGAAMATDKAKELMKLAADAIERHEKREEAVKLAFLMVEKGKCKPFETYDSFVEKVASLEVKNLDAVKEALEMDSDLTDFGKVAAAEEGNLQGSDKSTMEFFHKLSE